MPTYSFECEKCEHEFTVRASVRQYEKKEIECPKCKSTEVRHKIELVSVVTSKKS